MRRLGVLAAAVGLATSLAAGAAAYSPVGTDFRISTVGTDGDEDRDGFTPSVAYNPAANEYLVTWSGDGGGTDNQFQIWGQRLSAAGGELGVDFQISAATSASSPSVAYNPTANEYLVTWAGDQLPAGTDVDVFGQRLEADGDEVGADDFRISLVNPAGPDRAAFDPAVAYNPTANEYLATWSADGLAATDNDFEIFGQRLEADGDEVGTEDFRISTVEPAGGGNVAEEPSVVASPVANEYLVTWHGNPTPTNEFEIWGQRLNAAGADLGGDFQISNVEPAGTARSGRDPSVAYGSAANEYLVTWSGDGGAIDDELEIWGQRLSAAGGPQGGDFQISTVDPAGAARDGREPSVAYSPVANEYLATWSADGLAATDDELEIFGQRLTGAGAELGVDFRISAVGADDDTDRRAEHPALAFNPAVNEFLVAWQGDGLIPTDDEFEIFGRRLAPAVATPPVTPPGALPTAPVPPKKCRKGFKPKKVKGKRKCVRKKKK